MFGIGASWVSNSIHDFGNAPLALAGGLTALFVLLLAVLFALPFSLFDRVNQNIASAVIAFPCFWLIAEWFRGWVFTGFPWLYLGYGFIDTPLAGWAPLIGVLGIGWIAALAGAMLLLPLRAKRSWKAAAGAVLLIVLLFGAGAGLQKIDWTSASGKPVTVGSIQPAVPLAVKWNPGSLNEILTLYRQQTRQLGEVELIIWPESAIPRVAHRAQDYLRLIGQQASDNDASLLVGIPTQNPSTRNYYNSVIALGQASGSYHKQHLVPFGEYVPLEQWLRGTIDFFDLPMSSFSAGSSQQPLIQAQGMAVATAICYEIAYHGLVADLSRDSNMILTVSNDSWFGDSLGPKQHFQMARMRAVENSKPLVRSTNDGISAIIDHRGNITAIIPAFERAILKGTLTPQQGSTPFNHWGSTPILVFSLIVLAIATRKHQKK